MANAIKCDNCGKFEEGLGYSVRIYQNLENVDEKERKRTYAKRVVAEDNLCYECASAAAESISAVLIPEETGE